MYQPEPLVVASVGVGGGTSNYVEIAEVTTSGITHEEGQAAQATRGISRKVPAKPGAAAQTAPGTFSWELNPGDASAAILDLEAAQQSGDRRNFREDEGSAEAVHENTTGVSVAISGTGVLSLTGSGTGADIGSNLSPRTPWDRGLILVISNVAYFVEDLGDEAGDPGRVSRIGDVSSNIVTPTDDAIQAVTQTVSWDLYEYAIRREFRGTPTVAAGHSTSSDTRTKTVSGRLAGWPTITFLLANNA